MGYWESCQAFLRANRLPAPDEAAQAHSKALYQFVTERIAQQGTISFAQFMQDLLYHPQWGYYTTGATKFGGAGDFITAPEISPVFAKTLARQVAQVFTQCPSPVVVEFGPGTGRLALELFRELIVLEQIPTTYYLVELSAQLQARQQALIAELLPDYIQHFVWVTDLDDKVIDGVILANEVLDAMPVELFKLQDNAVMQCMLEMHDSRLQPVWHPADQNLLQALTPSLQRLEQPLASGYQSEFNPWAAPWLSSVSRLLRKGVVLLIDYGFEGNTFYHPQRHQGTLMCHYRHYSHTDPLVLMGLQDVTAHVNFTDLAYSADEMGLDVLGFATQGHFLLGAGILDLQQNKGQDDPRQIAYNQALKTLTLPHEMGELFKVLALGKQIDLPLIGFSLQDWRHKL